jgi:hypothetical protein
VSLNGGGGKSESKEDSSKLAGNLSNAERETLKKLLLLFGYGRWDKIREASTD